MRPWTNISMLDYEMDQIIYNVIPPAIPDAIVAINVYYFFGCRLSDVLEEVV